MESAEACVQAMNHRWYGGRQLEVAHWDGVTNYQVGGVATGGGIMHILKYARTF